MRVAAGGTMDEPAPLGGHRNRAARAALPMVVALLTWLNSEDDIMLSAMNIGFITVVGAAVLCPLCESRQAGAANVAPSVASVTVADTATARLHISGMTCGTCPTTARVALK